MSTAQCSAHRAIVNDEALLHQPTAKKICTEESRTMHDKDTKHWNNISRDALLWALALGAGEGLLRNGDLNKNSVPPIYVVYGE